MKTTDANSANGRMHPVVLTDFDDTAAAQNVAELLLNQFGVAYWKDVRREGISGDHLLKHQG